MITPAQRQKLVIGLAKNGKKMIKLTELGVPLYDAESPAAEQAKQVGLVYKGCGRWVDPQSGQNAPSTEDLIKIYNDYEDLHYPEASFIQGNAWEELEKRCTGVWID